jgi:hypothetical protein
MRTGKAFTKALVVLVAVLMVTAAVASNMAFKLNYLVQKSSTGSPPGTGTKASGGGCTTCGNWVSHPFQVQFAGQRLFQGICLGNPTFAAVAQPGTSIGLGDLTVLNPNNIDAIVTTNCTAPSPTVTPNPVYQPNAGVRIILRGTAPGDVQYIIVGADLPGTQQIVRKSSTATPPGTGTKAAGGGCVTCGNWVQLPYHTTARRAFDLCDPTFAAVAQAGTSTGLGDATVLNPNNVDAIVTTNCTAPSPTVTPNPLVQIGRPVRIILRGTALGDVMWSPAHF